MPDDTTGATGKKILIIDDEPDVADLVAYNLRAKGLATETLNDPANAIATARAFQPDLVILDVMMPRLNGIQLCRLFRADPALKNTPVIFLTARAEEHDRVQGLETGADDYICKPFSTKELVLRVQALLRRASGAPRSSAPASASVTNGVTLSPEASAQLRAGRVTLDTGRHIAAIAGAPLDLTATEFRLLRLLMEHRGRVQTRERLLLDVWRYQTEIQTRTVDTHVRRLREKLGAEAAWIETIRGVGYRLAENEPEP